MNELKNKMPTGVADFARIISKGAPYVDKTDYLANIIDSVGTAWYLSRPRRFGKTLTVSTLEYLFTGRRDLFKGLAIEKRLDEESFAPRPVLRLDLSKVRTADGLPLFEKDLAKYTRSRAKLLGVDLPSGEDSSSTLRELIMELGLKSPGGFAVLIDEYDAPLVRFLNRPHLLTDLREILLDYYMQIKGMDDIISFLFATGVSRNSHLGLFSAVNHISDLSRDSSYGAMLGFTLEELEKYFALQIEESARSLRMTKARLLEEMRAYYNGFSFDGETRVYNPYSTLLYFFSSSKRFLNYWFDTATSKSLVDFMRDKPLTVARLSGQTITESFARSPGPLDQTGPKGFLYQAGYLTLRRAPDDDGAFDPAGGPYAEGGALAPPDASDGERRPKATDEPPPTTSEKKYVLDYPNQEVRQAMSSLLVRTILGEDEAQDAGERLKAAFERGNVDGLVVEFNAMLAGADYGDYVKTPDPADPKRAEKPLGEGQYRSLLYALIWGSGLKAFPEVHSSRGRADMAIVGRGRDWVVELKLSDSPSGDTTKARAGLAQIISTGYAESLGDPILLAMAVSKRDRRVNRWVYRFGLDGADIWKSRESPAPPEAPEPSDSPPKSPRPRM
jgi:hypothetical protein